MLFAVPKGVRNLAGRKFVNLTAQRIVRVTRAEGAVWLCLCDCGRTREVPAKNLLTSRVRVTRCVPCARARRTEQLHAAFRESLRRAGGDTRARRGWREQLEALNPEQRADYDRMIAKRQRLGVPVTDSIRAEAVEMAMLKRAA